MLPPNMYGREALSLKERQMPNLQRKDKSVVEIMFEEKHIKRKIANNLMLMLGLGKAIHHLDIANTVGMAMYFGRMMAQDFEVEGQ